MTFELFCHFILLINQFLNYFHFTLLYYYLVRDVHVENVFGNDY